MDVYSARAQKSTPVAHLSIVVVGCWRNMSEALRRLLLRFGTPALGLQGLKNIPRWFHVILSLATIICKLRSAGEDQTQGRLNAQLPPPDVSVEQDQPDHPSVVEGQGFGWSLVLFPHSILNLEFKADIVKADPRLVNVSGDGGR